jgi:hypothetical protein
MSPEPWLRPYLILKSILEEHGMVLVKEELHPNVFGSAYSIYKVSEEELRLVWDGKDGAGFLERRTGGDWVAVSPYLTRADMDNPQKVSAFDDAVQRLADKR